MSKWRFKIVFDKLQEQSCLDRKEAMSQEDLDLLRESEEISELRRLAVDVAEDNDRFYTMT